MIKTYHNLKIPELIYIPVLSSLMNRALFKLEIRELSKIKEDKLGLNKEKRDKPIIASLTSFPARIEIVSYTVLTLLNQMLKPDRLILWLAEEQFPDKKLPEKLTGLIKYGLEIKWCDDLRSHKKYYYAIMENPNSIVVTFDDDIIYPEDYLYKLYKTHLEFPDAVVCNKAHKINIKNGVILPYNSWKTPLGFGTNSPEWLLMPVGCGGVLYPPGCLEDEVFNIENIKSLASAVDDIWLKFMSVLKGKKAILTTSYFRTLTCVPGSQTVHLAQSNCMNGNNDACFKKMLSAYPEFWSKVEEE